MSAKAKRVTKRLKFLDPETPVVLLALAFTGPRPRSLKAEG